MQDGWRPTPQGVVLQDPALSWITVIIQYSSTTIDIIRLLLGHYLTLLTRLTSLPPQPYPQRRACPCARCVPPPQERHWTTQCRCSVVAHAYGTDSHARRHRSLLASMLRRTTSARSAQEEHGGAASRRRRRGSAGGSTRACREASG